MPQHVSDTIARRVADGRYPGVVLGIIDGAGQSVYGFGSATLDARSPPRVPDEHTVYEIASLTKVFTGALLAVMVAQGDVGLDDPVASHLRPGAKVPSYHGEPITLLSRPRTPREFRTFLPTCPRSRIP